MPRECGWCGHPDRQAWEQRIASGEFVSVVAGTTPFSVSAASRHVRLHVRPGLVREMAGTDSTVNVASFAHKLLTLVSAAEGVRVFAEATSNPRMVLQAIKTEADTLNLLMQRLGVDSSETVELHQQAAALTKALAGIVRSDKHPGLAADLADRLDDAGHAGLAATIRTADTDNQQHHLEEKNQ